MTPLTDRNASVADELRPSDASGAKLKDEVVALAEVLTHRKLATTTEPNEAQKVQHVTLAPGNRASVSTIRR